MDGFIYGYTEDKVPITDITEFELALGNPNRAVARADLGCALVRTSYLVQDHDMLGARPFTEPNPHPWIYGTLVDVYPNAPEPVWELDGREWFWGSRDDALEGHAATVAMLDAEIKAGEKLAAEDGEN